MTSSDLDIIVSSVAPVMREFVTSRIEGLLERCVGLEQRLIAVEQRQMIPGPEGPRGEKGLDVDMAIVHAEIDFAVAKAIDAIEKPKDGKDGKSVEPFAVEMLVAQEVARAIAALPPPVNGQDGKDGASVSVDDIVPIVVAEVLKAVAALPIPTNGTDGKDGRSVEPAEVEALVLKAVAALPTPANGIDGKDGRSVELADVETLVLKAVAALPPPTNGMDGKDGTSVLLEDVIDDFHPLIVAEIQKRVDAIPKPKDAVGLLGAVIDRDGHLLVTLSDGTTKDLGVVVGADADRDLMLRQIEAEVAKFPKPKDGKDGADGFGFDDVGLPFKDGRPVLTFIKGDRVKEFPLHTPIYRGVWKEGDSYELGDCVTFANQTWIAQMPTTAKPEETIGLTPRAWILAVRRGRDGKPGLPGAKGLDGKPGRDGKGF
jgi:hypothetical protein